MERRSVGRFGAVITAAIAATQSAHASTNTSLSTLETPLQTLQKSLTGPVALAIGIIAFCITGGMLVFGGELSDFTKRTCYVLLVLGVLLTADSMVPLLFSSSTAVIQ